MDIKNDTRWTTPTISNNSPPRNLEFHHEQKARQGHFLRGMIDISLRGETVSASLGVDQSEVDAFRGHEDIMISEF